MLIAGGIFLLIFQGAFSGAWLAFIGWFLLLAAGEERLAQMREAYSGLPVSDLMVTDPVTVEPRLTLGQLMDDVFHARPHMTYPVVEDGTTLGLLPLTRLSQIDRSEWDERRVRDQMLPIDQVPRVHGDESAAEALAKLTADSVGRALVLDNGRLTGLVSISDIAHALEVGAHDGRRRQSHRGDRLPS
jgi:predicted transcriptional regulator